MIVSDQQRKLRWNLCEQGDCRGGFSVHPTTKNFPRTCRAKQKKHNRLEPGLFKKEFCCTEMNCLCSKKYC